MDRKESGFNYISVVALVLFSLVCLCMCGIQGIYSFSLFPDEFGYWAGAAKALGYDFSEITSIGSFYSFGYSLILMPVMKIFSDSVLAYRAAVVVNLLLQVSSFFIFTKIADRLFENTDRLTGAILSGIAVLYPSWVFYVQMTMSEALLFFMYTLVVFLMMFYLDNTSAYVGTLLAIATVYIYSVHMRAVGIPIAVICTLLIGCVLRKKRQGSDKDFLSAALPVLIILAGLIVCLFIKKYMIGALYLGGAENSTATNDYSGQMSKFAELFTLAGIGRFFAAMSGKILYLGCASFGLAYIGIYVLVKRVINKDIKALFVLLASLFQFLVMCIYLIHSADVVEDRFDLFLNGRYIDYVIPLLTVIGMNEILHCRVDIGKIASVVSVMIVSAAISCIVVLRNKVGMRDPHGMLMVGMSYFMDEKNVRPVRTIVISTVFALLIMFTLIGIALFYQKSRNFYILFFIHLFLIGLSYSACDHFIYIGQSYIYGDIQVADEIASLRKEGHSGDVILVYEGGLEYIDTVQFRLRDEHIGVIYAGIRGELSKLKDDDLVLVDYESDLNAELSKEYDSSWESGHFELYYNKVGREN
ncbi:hypothetical protein [Butyrivibrio sp. LB2008]|uniref:hypothetical protein n=1 Tax=Butyrivibrio sp. LB2008 TaxID=1408305 RepID=UPI000478C5B2|nr:hypothetical protein [Butyrivibrio sp. LB2008]